MLENGNPNPFKITLHHDFQQINCPVKNDIGFTDSVKKRLEKETQKLKPIQKICSLDEMNIKPQCVYDSKLDIFFGSAYFCGFFLYVYVLSTKYCIPCGYYFTKKLTVCNIVM